jgi:hypothetical protein
MKALLVQRLLLVFVTSSSWFAKATLRRVTTKSPSTELEVMNHESMLYCQLSLNIVLKASTMPANLHVPTTKISSRSTTRRLNDQLEEFISCIPVGSEEGIGSIAGNSHVPGGMYTLEVPDWLIQPELSRLISGQEAVIVAIPGASLTSDSVIVPNPDQMFVVSKPSRLLRSQNQRILGRKPASKGSLTVTTLRVSTLDSEPDYTAQELYQLLYEGNPSFREQYIKCSSGQLVMEPSRYGVMDIRVNLTLATVTSIAGLVNEAMLVANGLVEDSNGILDNTDLLMIDLPPGTGDWAAYATISGKQVCLNAMFLLLTCILLVITHRFMLDLALVILHSPKIKSVYNNNWAAYLGGPMHEVGHNLGLRHAFENGTEYEDRTGYMGSMPNTTRFPVQCKAP